MTSKRSLVNQLVITLVVGLPGSGLNISRHFFLPAYRLSFAPKNLGCEINEDKAADSQSPFSAGRQKILVTQSVATRDNGPRKAS
jgi:flagellar basal body P-ring protein FlgI